MSRLRRCGRSPLLVVLGLIVLVSGAPGFVAGMPAAVAADNSNCTAPVDAQYRPTPWAQTRLGVARVWSITRGAGQRVAVIDSGVDASVPQLAGRVEAGADVTGGTDDARTDCNGHGTFVAGIIAAAPARGTGFAGVAPEATLLPIRQTGDNSEGTASGMAAAIRLAVDRGCRLINISASSFENVPVLALAVQYAQRHNVLIVASASNEAQQGNPVAYPAAYPGVLAVGSIGADGKRSSFSETGSYVALAAPGDGIVSLSRGGRGETSGQGTSYAAPFVTGTAALVWAAHPELTAAQVAHRLEATADAPGTKVPDTGVGYGVVDPWAAVTSVLPEEQGWKASASPRGTLAQAPAAAPDTRPRGRSLGLMFGGGVGVITAGVLGAVLAAGRRRRWQIPA